MISTESPTRESPSQASLKSALPWILLGLVMVVILSFLLWPLFRPISSRVEGLPMLGSVQEFSLVDQNNRPVTRADLLGKIWVADFIFTRCQGQCPMMSQTMNHIQAQISNQTPFELISISVNPDFDSPAILKNYAQRFSAGPHWHFLTGSQKTIFSLSRDSFKLGVMTDPQHLVEPVTHSSRIMLMDSQARIRAYYDGLDPQTTEKIIQDIRCLSTSPCDVR